MGRYFVSRTQVRDRSRAPGVWEEVWKQIPYVGEEPVKKDKQSGEKRPAVAANRPAVTTTTTTAKLTSARRNKR